ncbi:MAG: hypothetical protein AB4042_10140 [Leptolyngbyaceae cyanobacterium]
MKNRHWLEFTEYASFAGVAAGAVFSVLLEKALLLSTPLSVALLVGFANRRRVEQMQELQTETSVAALKQKLSKQIKTLDHHIKTLPTPEMVGDVRNSMLRHSRDELKQLTLKIDTINETIDQYATLLDDEHLGGVKDEVQQLQGFYREMYGSLKRVQQTVEQVSAQSDSQDVTAQMAQLRAEAERIQTGLQTLNDQTQPTLSYLQEQVNQLNRQNTTLVQQVDANSLKRELDMLMDAVADLAPKRDLNSVMADIRDLQENQENQGQSEESLRKQLQTVMQRLQAVPDVPQFRAQIEETLSWQLRDINQQLRSLQNTKQFHSKVKEVLTGELDTINRQLQARSERPLYKLIFDVHPNDLAETNSVVDGAKPTMLGSRQLLEEALTTAKQRLILIWPWSSTLKMDKPLMRKLEAFVKGGRRLEVGWCHITASNEQRFLSVINRRWNLDSLAQRSLQLTLKYLLALKRRYPKQVKFQVMGTVENFLVADRSFAALGIENRLTTITPLEDVSLKLWTADKAVIQQLIQTFNHTELNPEDMESHWNRAITRYELGDRTGAMADIEQILAVNPKSAIAYNMRGIIQFEQEETAAALADFGQALTLDDSQVSAYCNRGFLLSEQGDQYGAMSDFGLAIKSSANVDNPTALGIAYFYRGLACQRLDDFEGAISDYTNAFRYIPESPVIRYHRGITYQAIDYHVAAIEDLEQATTLFQQQNSKTNAQRAARHLQQSHAALAAQEQNPAPDFVLSVADDEVSGIGKHPQSETRNGHGDVTAEFAEAPEVLFPEVNGAAINGAAINGAAIAPAAETTVPVARGTDLPTGETTSESSLPEPSLPNPSSNEDSVPQPSMPVLTSEEPISETPISAAIPSEAPTTAVLPSVVSSPEAPIADTDEAAQPDYSVATPSFLFPGEDRSQPTGIEDLDEAAIEFSEEWSSATSDTSSDDYSSPQAVPSVEIPQMESQQEQQTEEVQRTDNHQEPTVSASTSDDETNEIDKTPETTETEVAATDQTTTTSSAEDQTLDLFASDEAGEIEVAATDQTSATSAVEDRTLDLFASLEDDQTTVASVEADRLDTATTIEATTADFFAVDDVAIATVEEEAKAAMELTDPASADTPSTVKADNPAPDGETEADMAIAVSGSEDSALKTPDVEAVTLAESPDIPFPDRETATPPEMTSPTKVPESAVPEQEPVVRLGPKRRRKTDLDRLVTTTLTDFFDEVDLANLDAEKLSVFAAEVQASGMAASGTSSSGMAASGMAASGTAASGTASPSKKPPQNPETQTDWQPNSEPVDDINQETDSDTDQGLDLFDEALFGEAREETGPEDSNEQSDRPPSIVQPPNPQPVSTLDSPASLQESVKVEPPAAVEVAAEVEALDEAVVDASESSSSFPKAKRSRSSQNEPEEIEKLVTSTLTNFFADLSDREIREAMSAYSAQLENETAELAEAQQPGDNDPSHDQPQAPPSNRFPEDDVHSSAYSTTVAEAVNEEVNEDALFDPELQQLITSATTAATESTVADTETETLGNFMDSLEDPLEGDGLCEDDVYAHDSWEMETVAPSQPIKPPIQPINADLLADPWRSEARQDNFSGEDPQTKANEGQVNPGADDAHPTESSGPISTANPTLEQIDTGDQPIIDQLPTPDGMELGTATITNFMAAMEGEDLGVQTLSDFFSVLNDELPDPAGELPSNSPEAEQARSEDDEQRVEEECDRHPSAPQPQNDPPSNSSDSDPYTEADLDNFESLLDLSDRF